MTNINKSEAVIKQLWEILTGLDIDPNIKFQIDMLMYKIVQYVNESNVQLMIDHIGRIKIATENLDKDERNIFFDELLKLWEESK